MTAMTIVIIEVDNNDRSDVSDLAIRVVMSQLCPELHAVLAPLHL